MEDDHFDFTFALPQAIPVVYDWNTPDQGGVSNPDNMQAGEGSSDNLQPTFHFKIPAPPPRSSDTQSLDARSSTVAMKRSVKPRTTLATRRVVQTLPAVAHEHATPAAPAEAPEILAGDGNTFLATRMDNPDGLRAISKSLLVRINYDVQEHIMSFLPGSSLSALTMTCRYFSEAAFPSLCKLAWLPFCLHEDLLSFRSFLRIGSSTRRWQHIRKLDFRLRWLTSEPLHEIRELTKLSHDCDHPESMMDVLLHTLRACRNLESLHILNVDLCNEHDTQVLYQIISTLPALAKLRMELPQDVTDRMLRKLAKPHLRTLAFYHRMNYDAGAPELIQHLCSLRQSLVELCLPRFHGCIFPPGVVFPCAQRLTIGFPGPTPQSLPDVLRQSFPHLLHLRMAGSARWHISMSEAGRAQLESLREHHEREWRSKPNAWPALASLSCDRKTSESGLYGLAIPRHIPYLSVRFDGSADRWDTKTARIHASRSAVLVTDVRPFCLELRMTILSHQSFRTMASEDDTACLEFNILHTSAYPSPLLRFVLTIERDVVATRGETATDALCRELPQLSLTHLLIRHCGEPPELRALLGENDMLAQQERMAAINASAHETASVLVEASRTLRWVGIQAHGHALRSWEVLRMPSNSSAPRDAAQLKTAAVLQELDEQGGQNVLITEGMVDVESSFVQL